MSAPAGSSRLDGLLTEVDGQPHLAGSHCETCGTDTFPVQASCPRCGSEAVGPVTLPTTGTVWTWTVQRFAPKPPFQAPKVFEPFAVAYVDLGTVRVEGRLDGKAADAWKIGDAVRLVVGPLDASDPAGEAYWFEPTSTKEHN
jgi:uncharacterized OB-fold protein